MTLQHPPFKEGRALKPRGGFVAAEGGMFPSCLVLAVRYARLFQALAWKRDVPKRDGVIFLALPQSGIGLRLLGL